MLLAQLVDLLPDWNWSLLLAAGMLSPIADFLLSIALHGFRPRRAWTIVVFYGLALAAYVLSLTPNVLGACSFLILLPVGILLGFVLLLPTRGTRHSSRCCARCGCYLRDTTDPCPECGTVRRIRDIE